MQELFSIAYPDIDAANASFLASFRHENSPAARFRAAPHFTLAFGCSRYAEGCDFKVYPKIAGKMVEREHLVELLENGITSEFVQGMTNRQGKRFDARLKLTEEFKVTFWFKKDPPAAAQAPSGARV